MAEAEPVEEFDFGTKKKKRGKKTMVSLDDDGSAAPTVEAVVVKEETPVETPVETKPKEEAAPADTGEFNFGKKKKKKKDKKKKTGFDIDAAEAAAEGGGDTPSSKGKEPAAAPAPVVVVSVVDYSALSTEFELPLRKKIKRAKVAEEYALDGGEAEGAAEIDPEQYIDKSPWAGSDRDYMYTELLERAFDIMRTKNPGATQGEKRRFVMKPPQVIRLGSKKSGFINFVEICKLMHRTPDHVLSYLLAELGTSGTLDGSDVLVLKGRFQQKQMESVLRRYIREYVTCTTCRSPDTILSRANRMFFLTCETCAARYSVSTISAGYSAVVGRRSRIRAAQGN